MQPVEKQSIFRPAGTQPNKHQTVLLRPHGSAQLNLDLAATNIAQATPANDEEFPALPTPANLQTPTPPPAPPAPAPAPPTAQTEQPIPERPTPELAQPQPAPVHQGFGPALWEYIKFTLPKNETIFVMDDVWLSIQSALTTTDLPEGQPEFFVIPRPTRGPFLVKARPAIAAFLLAGQEAILYSETETELFQVKRCDESGMEEIADWTPQEREERVRNRADEKTRTRAFFVQHPSELIGVLSAEHLKELQAFIKEKFTRMAGQSAVRIAVAGGAKTKMGFPIPQTMVFVTLRNDTDDHDGRIAWSKAIWGLSAKPAIVSMPKSTLTRLGLKPCCFKPECTRNEAGHCTIASMLRPKRQYAGGDFESPEAKRAVKEAGQEQKRHERQLAMRQKLARKPCPFLAKGQCLRGFATGDGNACLYLHG